MRHIAPKMRKNNLFRHYSTPSNKTSMHIGDLVHIHLGYLSAKRYQKLGFIAFNMAKFEQASNVVPKKLNVVGKM